MFIQVLFLSSTIVPLNLRLSFTVLAVAAALVSILTAQPSLSRESDWVAYGGDNRSQKYSSLSQINEANAKDLRIVWRWSSPDNEIVKARPELHLNLFKGTPLMLDGNLYVATGLHQVASIHAGTGKTRWVYDPGIYERGTPQRLGFVHRGVAAWQGRIFLASGEGYLTALDMSTGKPIAEFGQDGRVDLLEGIRRPVERFQFGTNSPPIVVGDVLVVGSFVQDGWRYMQGPPGDVRGYDPRTGELLWTFHTVPVAGDEGVDTWLEDSWRYSGSTNVWSLMSADEELGFVYLPTSAPTNDHYGGHRPGDNLFGESIICLDARTGERVWHFQTSHHGLWDYDLPAAPVLADVTVDGQRRQVLAQVSKQGFVYVLDRKTGQPIWEILERPVPQSRVSGEHSSPTQPFPTRPAAFDRQGLSRDDLIDFTPQLRREALDIVRQFDSDGLYTPPSERGAVQSPGILGGASWSGATLDRESGWLYVPSITAPFIVRLARPEPGTSDMRFLPQRFGLDGPDGLPITKPPYGRITAIDLNTGNHRWVVPLGSGPRRHARLKDLNLPPLGWPSRGFVLATKSLLFAVQEPDETGYLSPATNTRNTTAIIREPRLWVLAKRSGRAVSETELPANAGGAPMTYSLQSRQFIVVPVGGGGLPAELVALALESAED